MADRFQLFRLSLLPRAQIDAFTDPNPTREGYLRQVLGERQEFSHYGHRFHYVPSKQADEGAAIFGLLGRGTVIEENLPPDQGLGDYTHPGWRACVLAVDPTSHEDGQKAALEINKEIGGAPALMAALAQAINQANPHTAFVIEAAPLIDAESFWQFAEANYGNITSLTFDLVAPNGLWSTSSDLKDELADLRKSLKAQEVLSTFRSDEGIETKAERIKEAVHYAETGGGKIRAKARGGKLFNSTDRPKTTTIEEDRRPGESLLSAAVRRLQKVLGR